MKRKILYVLSLGFITLHCMAQKYNAVYIEAGGNTLIYSVNYDRIIPISTQFRLAPRVGFSYFPYTSKNNNRDYTNIRIPLELNLLWGKTQTSRNFVEAGFGLSLIGLIGGYKTDSQGNITSEIVNKNAKVGVIRLGYRYQKPKGGLMFRAGALIPVSQDEYSEQKMGDDIFYRIYGGLSLGYSF